MTDQKHEFARVDLQRDIMQRRLVRLRGIHLGHVIERDDRRSDGLLLHLFDRNRRKGRGKIGEDPRLGGALRLGAVRGSLLLRDGMHGARRLRATLCALGGGHGGRPRSIVSGGRMAALGRKRRRIGADVFESKTLRIVGVRH